LFASEQPAVKVIIVVIVQTVLFFFRAEKWFEMFL